MEDHRDPVPVVGGEQAGTGRHDGAHREHGEHRQAGQQAGEGEVDRERVEEPQARRGEHEVRDELAEVLGAVHREQPLDREERALQDQPHDVEVVGREDPAPGLHPGPAHGTRGHQAAEDEEERHPHRLERHRHPEPGVHDRPEGGLHGGPQGGRGLQREVLDHGVVQHHQQNAGALGDVDPEQPSLRARGEGTGRGLTTGPGGGGWEGHRDSVGPGTVRPRTDDDVSLVTAARTARSPRCDRAA